MPELDAFTTAFQRDPWIGIIVLLVLALAICVLLPGPRRR